MAIVSKSSPKGVDTVIDQIQQYLFANLSGAGWTDYECYPRANKNLKGTSIIPEVSTDVKNYIEVLFDDTHNATSFFLVDDQVDFNNEERLIVQNVQLIFQVNLPKLFPLITDHRADEEMHSQIMQLLTQNEDLFVDVDGYVTTVDKVYSGLRLQNYSRGNTPLDDMSEFHVVRFDFTVTYDADDCQTVFTPACEPASILINGESFAIVSSGSSLDIAVKDTNGLSVGSEVGGDWIVPSAPTSPKTVTFNRPQVSTDVSYTDFDAAWRKQNGHIPTRTANQFQQELDADDPFKIKFDDSAITGITEHLFRFVSVTGGYLDHDAGTDTFTFFDKNGGASTRSTVFTKGSDILMIDRLTGIAFAPNNQLESGGGKTATDFYNDLWNTTSISGYTGEWFAPSIEELTVMMLFQTYAGIYYFLWRDTNFTNFSIVSLSSSPYMANPSVSIVGMSVNGILPISWSRTNTTATGRHYLPCRTFDWNDYTG